MMHLAQQSVFDAQNIFDSYKMKTYRPTEVNRSGLHSSLSKAKTGEINVDS